MIHTIKLDKYEKYDYILSTVNLRQYSVIIWMTDEMLIECSLLPFIKVALQRGYHQYKDLVVQTPRYYLNPYPILAGDVVLRKDEPSLFKSPTPVPAINETNIEVQVYQPANFIFNEHGRFFQFINEMVPLDDVQDPMYNFMLNNEKEKAYPLDMVGVIKETSTQPLHADPMHTFILNDEKTYQFSNTVGPIRDVSTQPSQGDPMYKYILNEEKSYQFSNTVGPIRDVSTQPSQGDPMYKYILNEEKTYQFSDKVGPIRDVSTQPSQGDPMYKYILNDEKSYQFSNTVGPIRDVSTQPSQGDPMYKYILNEEKMYQFSDKVGPIRDVSTQQGQPKPKDRMLQRSFFKVSNRIPVPTISKETKQIIKQRYMLSNTIISFTNILFREKTMVRKVKVETLSEKVEKERALWMNQLPTLRKIILPERVDGCMYETVLIAFQPLAYLEYCVRKLMLQLPTWSHTIICGNENTEMVTNWNLPIQVVSLDIDSITEENYNELLLMESFWSLFQGETLLVYGEESRLLNMSIDGWLNKKYAKLDNGMTVRSKTAIMERIRTNPPEEGMMEQIYFSSL